MRVRTVLTGKKLHLSIHHVRAGASRQEPNLHAQLLHRTVLRNTVIDHEEVTRTFPEGPGTIQLLAIYEVQAGKIRKAWFLSGVKILN